MLTLAISIAVLSFLFTLYVAAHQPWLGVSFEPQADHPSLVVADIDPRSPNYGSLKQGDIVIGLSSAGQEERFVAGMLPLGDVYLRTFAVFNQYMAHHKTAWNILTHGEFEFLLADGRRITGAVAKQRPYTDLPWRIWSLGIAGITAFSIGFGIWIYQSRLPAAPMILIGAVACLVSTLLAGLATSREVTLSPFWFRISAQEANIASEIMIYALVALLWYYPNRISRLPVAGICMLVALLLLLNKSLQLIDLPIHTVIIHMPLAFVFFVFIAIYQWRNTRDEAVSRASLQWLLMTLLLAATAFMALDVVPSILLGRSFVETYMSYFFVPIIYLGLALGVARVRLFDLDRWWLETWLWVAGGVLIITLDVILINMVDLQNAMALSIALIVVGWIYFPIRQQLFRRILRTPHARIEDYFPVLMETLFGEESEKTFDGRWQQFVQRVFMPLTSVRVPQPAGQAVLAESGLVLQVPSFDGQSTLELRYHDKGRRLYTPRDATLANTLLALTRRAAGLWEAQKSAASTERSRIMRDLHDDVASRLLSLIRRGSDSEMQNEIRETLTSLRQVIYALDDNQPRTLESFLLELQAAMRAGLQDTNIHFHWADPSVVPEYAMSARQRVNLTRALQEGMSNAVRHGAPENVTVTCNIAEGLLKLKLCNDGTILRMEDWQPGKGLHNIRSRMSDIGGAADWIVNSQDKDAKPTCCMQLSFPLAAHT